MTSEEPDAVDAALLERYRQASSAEGLEPTEAVRAAILAEGRRIAQQRAAAPPLRSFDTSRPAANQSRFRLAAFGTFGIAILAVLLIVPRWLISPASRPQMAETRSAPLSAREAAVPNASAPSAADAPPLAETPAAPASRQVAAGAPAKRPAQPSTDQIAQPLSQHSRGAQLAGNAPPVSNAAQADSNAVTAARSAQNRNFSPSATGCAARRLRHRRPPPHRRLL